VDDDVDDEAVFRSAFEATDEDLLRFVERRVPPPAAEDVVAEVFLVAWRRLSDVPAAPEEAPHPRRSARTTALPWPLASISRMPGRG
jgi:DNA-directed RNA polymerase specialized sigma24 family protein